MKEFKDPAIREMLRRRHAAVPPLSDSFEEKLFAAYEQRKRLQKRRNVRRLTLWPSIAAAATVALLLTLRMFLPLPEPEKKWPDLQSKSRMRGGGGSLPESSSPLAQVHTSSVKDITAPIEPTSSVSSLSEVSPKKKHKTHKRKSRVITQEEVTDNTVAVASEYNAEEQSLQVATRGTVALSSHLNDIRQKVRDDVPFYNLAMANVNNELYD